jgi:hypothetical protein
MCPVHLRTGAFTPDRRRANGRKGGRARAQTQRAAREAIAEAVRLETIEELRATLRHALQLAARKGDAMAMIRGVVAGAHLLETGALEKQIATLREQLAAVEARFSVDRREAIH